MKKRIKASSAAPFQSLSSVEGFLRLRKLLILFAFVAGSNPAGLDPQPNNRKSVGCTLGVLDECLAAVYPS